MTQAKFWLRKTINKPLGIESLAIHEDFAAHENPATHIGY
tara:strand:+ start:365 stop:484 length:120 start_codon:yes stop_codon:yes gene_type:complete